MGNLANRTTLYHTAPYTKMLFRSTQTEDKYPAARLLGRFQCSLWCSRIRPDAVSRHYRIHQPGDIQDQGSPTLSTWHDSTSGTLWCSNTEQAAQHSHEGSGCGIAGCVCLVRQYHSSMLAQHASRSPEHLRIQSGRQYTLKNPSKQLETCSY